MVNNNNLNKFHIILIIQFQRQVIKSNFTNKILWVHIVNFISVTI